MTLNGEAFELPTSAPRTGASASSSSRSGAELPTPRATRGGSATETVALLPSPRTSDTNGPGEHGDGGPDLRTAVSLLPSPVCTDAIGARNSIAYRSPEAGRAHAGDTLTDWLWKREGHVDPKMLLTSTCNDARNNGGESQMRRKSPGLNGEVTLLPTPAVVDMGRGRTVDEWDEWTDEQKARHGNGNGHGKSLEIESLRLLPTPRASDGEKGGPNQRGSSGDLMLPSAVVQAWGEYAPAIIRWEGALVRPAPEPTERDWDSWRKARARRFTSKLPIGYRGSVRRFTEPPPPRLSPRFVEWMMGLPEGHVTDPAIGITRSEQLKALGNGVVPQQAAAALSDMLAAAGILDQAVAS